MRLGYTDDQRQLQELFRDFFAREAGPSVARAAEPLGFSADLWRKLEQTGAPAMSTPGGGDASLTDLSLVATELGRALAPVPLLEHLVAARLISQADPDRSLPERVAFAAEPAEAGVARAVAGAAVCPAVVALDGPDLVLVEPAAPVTATPNLASLPLVDVDLRAGDRVVLATGEPAVRLFQEATACWRTLLAAALLGVAEAALDLGRTYVLQRQQFGVAIGSFQAVQHALAGLPPMIDGARLLVAKAAWALQHHPEPVVDLAHNDITDGQVLAKMAYVFAGQTAKESTKRSLQCHGGYGYSAEYDIQLYYRRARGWALMGGSPATVLRELAKDCGVTT